MDDLKELRVELLVSFQKKDVRCPDETAFRGLLTSARLETTADTLSHDNLTVGYQLQLCKTEHGERIFHITLICTDATKIGAFEDLFRKLKKLFSESEIHARILWTDMALYYGAKAYPLIYRVENLMRQLIDQFMYSISGQNWESEHIPEKIKQEISKAQNKDSKNPLVGELQAIDFIQLTNFLFAEHDPRDVSTILSRLREAQELKDLNLDELQTLIPTSPWDRYFAKMVECDGDTLESEWQKLYELRCSVAHNRLIDAGKYKQIEELTAKISEVLQKAIDNLSSVKVPKLQVETLEKEMREKYTRSRRSSDLSKIPSRFDMYDPHYESMAKALQDATTVSQAQDMLASFALAAEYNVGLGSPALEALNKQAELQRQITASLQGMTAADHFEQLETAADLFKQLDQHNAETLRALDVDQELLAAAAHIDDGLLAIDASAELKRFNALINPGHDPHSFLETPSASDESETDEDE